MGDNYLTLQIYRIRIALLKEGFKVQCVVSFKNQRYELQNFEGKDAVFQWQDLLFNFDVKQNELNNKFKIEVFKKKGKLFSLLGSQEYEFKDFISTINRGTETTFDIEKKTKYAGSFHFNVETTSWKIVRDYLKSPQDIDKALSIITELAKTNTPKLSSYLSSGALQELMSLQRSITVVNPDPKHLETINKLLPIWELIVGGQDNNLRKKLVDSGLLNFFAEMMTVDLEVTMLGFMNCLKSFFTFASHQEQMIKTGVMKTLIKSLRSKNTKVFIKAAEVLFYFDEKYQKEMIKNGMIKQLMKVLTNKSSSAEARTKSMSLLQYFDTKYQDELVSAGTLKQIIKIIQSDSETFVEGVVIKALAVIQRFTVDQLRDYVKDGFLVALLSLMTLQDKPKVQECSTDLVEKMLNHFHNEMIEAGYLETLKKLMQDISVPAAMKYKLLSLMSSETAEMLIKHNCIPSITSLLQSEDTQLKLMTLQILTKQFSLSQLIESNLLPMLRLWLTGEEVKQNAASLQVYTNPFMNAWAYGVVSTLEEGILQQLLALLMSIAKSDVNTFCAEDLLSPIVKLLRHASDSIYNQAGEIIDYVQTKSPVKVLQSGYLEELMMTLAKANRYSAPFRRLSERFKKVPDQYPDYIEYMKQWPEMIKLLSEELTVSMNWPFGKIIIADFALKAPEYLTQFGLVRQFIMKPEIQTYLAPVVEALPNIEDILVEPECMRAVQTCLNSYRKTDFLKLSSKILRRLFQKYPMEAIQFGVVAELVKIFFTHNAEDVVELAFSLISLPIIEDTAFADSDSNELVDIIFGNNAPRKKLMLRWLNDHPVFLTMAPEKQKELHSKLLRVVFESRDKEVISEASRILGIMSTPESLATLFMAKPKVPYCSVALDTFNTTDFVINDSTVTLCRQESKSELAPENGGHWCSVGSAQSIEHYQHNDMITSSRYFEVRIDNTSKSRIVIGLAMESVQDLEYANHHAFKPWQQHIAPWQAASKPRKERLPDWAQSPWDTTESNYDEASPPTPPSESVDPPRFSKLSAVGYNCEDGAILVNGVADGPYLRGSFGPPLKTGDILGIYIELGTSTMSFYVNDKFLGTPVFPNFIYNAHTFATVSMFDDGDSVTFLPEPVIKIPRRPTLHMDRYFENALALVLKKTGQFPQTKLLYKASVDGWTNAIMHGKLWEAILFNGTAFVLKSSQNNKRVNTKPESTDAEPVQQESNVFAVYCGQKAHIHSNYEKAYSSASDVPPFVASISRQGARPFLTAEELEAKQSTVTETNDSSGNNDNADTTNTDGDANDNTNNTTNTTDNTNNTNFAVIPPPDYIPPPPPPPPREPKTPTYVPLPQNQTLFSLRALLTELNAPKKAPVAPVKRRNSLTLRGNLLDDIRNRHVDNRPVAAAPKRVPTHGPIPANPKRHELASGRRYANLLTPRKLTAQNCTAYQSKLIYMVQNGSMNGMFEDRNKLKIITPSMTLTDVLDASIVLDVENKFFHVVNADLEWDSYKLDDVEVYSNTTQYHLRWLIMLLVDSANKWLVDVLKCCYQIDPELVTLELEAAYKDHSLPSDVRSSLETFVSTELHIDLNTWTREAEHPLINSSDVAADSLAAFETPGDTSNRPIQMNNNNNNNNNNRNNATFTNILFQGPIPPPPPPPPPAPGKGSSIRDRIERANRVGGNLQDAINAITPEENELDQLLTELGANTITAPTVGDDDMDDIAQLMRELDADNEESGTTGSEPSGTESIEQSSEEMPRRVPLRRNSILRTRNPPPPPVPVQPQGNRVPCPVCATMVLENSINEHLDECLTMQALN